MAFAYAASVHAAGGRVAAALECLERAPVLGYRHVEWITCEPDFEPLRADPRFGALLLRGAPPEDVPRPGGDRQSGKPAAVKS